jgi:hypothetical protein
MSSKPAKPRSIASQLVLLFTLAAALVLCCGLGVLYVIVIRHAFEEDNAVLADKLASIRSDLDNNREPRALTDELTMLRRGQRVSYLVRVLDSSGNVVAESDGMSELLPRESFPAPETTNTRLRDVRSLRTQGKLFGLIAATEQAGGQLYTGAAGAGSLRR